MRERRRKTEGLGEREREREREGERESNSVPSVTFFPPLSSEGRTKYKERSVPVGTSLTIVFGEKKKKKEEMLTEAD